MSLFVSGNLTGLCGCAYVCVCVLVCMRVCVCVRVQIQIQKPSNLALARACWSNYKQRYTVKLLFVLSPAGKITFVSDAYPGRITDYDLVRLSGFLELVEPGDRYAADKGVTINPLLLPLQAMITMPPRKHTNQQQFSSDSAKEVHTQAKVRVHVERAIRKIKVFKYVSQTQPLHTLRYFSKAVFVVSMLVNYWGAPVGPKFMKKSVAAMEVRTTFSCWKAAACVAHLLLCAQKVKKNAAWSSANIRPCVLGESLPDAVLDESRYPAEGNEPEAEPYDPEVIIQFVRE